MHALDVLGNPIRRRLIELLAEQEMSSGDLVKIIAAEFDVTQPAVSYQLKILRQTGFASAFPQAQRRIYALKKEPFSAVEDWLEPILELWDHKLDALATEIARGKRKRRHK